MSFCPLCGYRNETISFICPKCRHPFNRTEPWDEWPEMDDCHPRIPVASLGKETKKEVSRDPEPD